MTRKSSLHIRMPVVSLSMPPLGQAGRVAMLLVTARGDGSRVIAGGDDREITLKALCSWFAQLHFKLCEAQECTRQECTKIH